MASVIPTALDLPDLSGLDDRLVARRNFWMSVGKGFPPSNAQHLVTAFTRAVETTLRSYERARKELVEAGAAEKLEDYLRGCSDLELTIIALNRAMRLGIALKASKETLVTNAQLPPKKECQRLVEMRNAIDHNDDPIINGEAGIGLALALEVGSSDLSINRSGEAIIVFQKELGSWIQTLHSLVVSLTNEPDDWIRRRRDSSAQRA